MEKLQVVIAGVSGKTGGAVARVLLQSAEVEVLAGVSRSWAGRDLGQALLGEERGIPVFATLAACLDQLPDRPSPT